jgi:hypothetical protein
MSKHLRQGDILQTFLCKPANNAKVLCLNKSFPNLNKKEQLIFSKFNWLLAIKGELKRPGNNPAVINSKTATAGGLVIRFSLVLRSAAENNNIIRSTTKCIADVFSHFFPTDMILSLSDPVGWNDLYFEISFSSL